MHGVLKVCGMVCGLLLLMIVAISARLYMLPPMAAIPSVAMRGPAENNGAIRGQFHVHSSRSFDSSGSLEEITLAAKVAGMRWIILTDHHPVPMHVRPEDGKLVSATRNGVLFVYGAEEYREHQGSLLTAGTEDMEVSLRACGHVEEYMKANDLTWDALELVNLHANALENIWPVFAYLFAAPEQLYRRMLHVRAENMEFWQRESERRGRPIPIFSATDAHANLHLFGKTLDPYETLFTLTSTHVILSDGEELTAANLILAMKKGRTFISFLSSADPGGFSFTAADDHGNLHETGSAVNGVARLIVKNPASEGTEIRIYRDNRLYTSKTELHEMEFRVPSPGFWRVEIYRYMHPWIISGQILVRD